jgi:chemotaxis methyl-accepting protein methylase
VLKLEGEDLAAVRAWMGQTLGLRGEDYRPAFLARRLWSRIKASGGGDVKAYLADLGTDSAEAGLLASKFLVPTTEFFRNPEVFQALGDAIEVRAKRPGWSPLRVVSAPCSTGEEAASLAILLAERGLRGRILAMDRSLRALRVLRAGAYDQRTVEKVDLRRRARYFKQGGEKSTVGPELASRILPLCCDLGKGVPARGVHVMMMRNLFIYLTEVAQARFLENAGRVLVPGGLLVMGRVEVLPRGLRGWSLVERDARIYEWNGGAG